MSVGAQLRASREARGLSIDAVAHTTRVHARILAAIERDDLSAVPPPPFGRGFVRAYAREMGLDGDRTAQDYFAQFAPAVESSVAARESPNRGSLLWPFAVVSLGVLAGVGLALRTGRPSPEPAETTVETPVVQPPGPSAQPSAARAASDASSATSTQAPKAPAPAATLTVVLTATQPCWVDASADGRRVLYATVTPGAPHTLTATDEILIRAGDAGALFWSVNGREPVLMGEPGQVRNVRVTPATAAVVR
jgi:cytoskeletal protein RodZ